MKKKKVLPAPSAMVMTAMSYESGSKQAFVSSNVAGGSGRAVKGRFGNENGITGKGGISGKECRGSGFSIRGRGVMKRSVSLSRKGLCLEVLCFAHATHTADNCYARCGVDGKQLTDSDDDDDDDDDDHDDHDDDEFQEIHKEQWGFL